MPTKKLSKANTNLYCKALIWLASNDDNTWLDLPGVPHASVAATLVADLFDVTDLDVRNDLRRAITSLDKFSKKSGAAT